MSRANKVKFNLKNVHYARIIESELGVVAFDTPVHIAGAVSLEMEAKGELSPFYADGGIYHTTSSNDGYEGSVEFARIPEHFEETILGKTKDANGIIVETNVDRNTPFALLFEFDGDVKSTRHCLYNCTASRTGIASKTSEGSIEVATESMNLTAAALPNGIVSVRTGPDSADSVYEDWYKAVYQKTDEVKVAKAK